MKTYNSVSVLIVSLALLFFSACQERVDNFDNKAYLTTDKVNPIMFKASVKTSDQTMITSVARPAPQDINFSYSVDPSLVDTYNQAYYDHAVLLPPKYYQIPDAKDQIVRSAVESKGVTIHFSQLDQLNTDLVYVLPVTADSPDIPFLSTANTTYYVFRGAALINEVADMEKNYLHIDQWKNPDVVNNLHQLTIEALIRARTFDKMISSVMGIEGYFLIRIGDAGFPSNQLQVATNRGNFPARDTNKGLDVNVWNHIAVTLDCDKHEANIYVNGKLQSSGLLQAQPVDFAKDGKDGFYIGRSYDDTRYLTGEFSECRIWNKVLSADEIKAPFHFYEVDPKSPGLVAYWKCDESAGSVVKDATGNGNDLTATNPILWHSVILPEKDK